MTTSKRTTRGTSSGARPDNGATAPSAAPPGTTPPKARARQRKSAAGSSRASASQTAPTESARPALDRYASIAQAAYFRSQHRGFKPGHEMEDWLAAEAEVDQRLRGEGRTSGDSTD